MKIYLYDTWYDIIDNIHEYIDGTEINISLQDTTPLVLHYINKFQNMTKLILCNIQNNTLISNILQNILHLCTNLKEIHLDFEYIRGMTLEAQQDVINLFKLITSNNTITTLHVNNRQNHSIIESCVNEWLCTKNNINQINKSLNNLRL